MKPIRRLAPCSAIVAAGLYCAGAPPARAEPSSKSADVTEGEVKLGEEHAPGGVRWRPERELRFGTVDYVVLGVAAGASVGLGLASPHERHWRGGILFDEDVRDVVRIGSAGGRYFVRDMSDVGLSLLTTWPFLVDALIIAWWYRGRADIAQKLTFVSLQAFAIASAVQGAANVAGSRERPFGRLCNDEIPERSVDCESSNARFRSFFSGHATLSFTSAGLLCAHHIGLGLLGKVGDIVTCAAGVGVATITSLFRVMSDMHYATDVGIGVIVGTAAGLAVPILHFAPPVELPADKVEIRVGPVGQGIGVMGTF
ncbi:MAG TPA: phosphatase PAP2 family protein [Labilithrix sp.]|nr:phosphatase PAP2 family protein [Labilithrix sp.]